MATVVRTHAQYQFNYAEQYGNLAQSADVQSSGNSAYISYRLVAPLDLDPFGQQIFSPASGGQALVITEHGTNGSLIDAIHINVSQNITDHYFLVNSLGEVFVALTHTGSINLDVKNSQTPTTYTHIPNNNSQINLTLARYDASGNLSKSVNTKISDSFIQSEVNLALKNDDDFYLSVLLGSISDMSLNATTSSSFPSGLFAGSYTDFALDHGRSFQSDLQVRSLETDDDGSVFIAAIQSNNNSNVILNDQSLSLATPNLSRAFVAKYNSSMDYINHLDFGDGGIVSSLDLQISNNQLYISGKAISEAQIQANSNALNRLYLNPGNQTFDATAPGSNSAYILAQYDRFLNYQQVLKFGFGDSQFSETAHASFFVKVKNGKQLVAITSNTRNENLDIDYLAGNEDKHLFAKGRRAIMVFDANNDNEPVFIVGGLAPFFQLGTILDNGDIFYTAAFTSLNTDLDISSGVQLSTNTFGTYITSLSSCSVSESRSTRTFCGAETINTDINGRSFSEAGQYFYFTENTTGCYDKFVVDVVQPTELLINSATEADISCNGANDGSITLSVSGGVTPYSYKLNNAATAIALPTNQIISGLSAGTYDLTIIDGNNCEKTVNSISIQEPAAILVQLSSISPTSTCGGTDGSIEIDIDDGTAPYSISLDGGVTTNTTAAGPGLANIFNLSAGVYTITVTDANGCTTENSGITVADPPGATILGVDITPPTCVNDSDGAFTVFANSNSMPILYSIDGGNTFQPSGTFQNLAGGTYTVTVKDDSDCTASQTVNVIPPPSIVLGGTTVDLSCNGAGDGQIDLSTSSGGTGILEYSIDGGTTYQASGLFTGLAADAYTLSIRDENGCTQTSNATLTEPNAIIASIDNIQTVSCNGADDGVVTLDVSGGTGPYEVSADGTNFQVLPANGQITGIGPVTIQNVTIRDANGCEVVIAGFNMTEPDAITITNPVVDNVSCDGAADGNIDLTGAVTGGTGAYTYSIDATNFQSSPVFSGLDPGAYDIFVLDANNCTGTLNVVITEPDALKVNPDQADVTCNGADNGVILVNAEGGTTPYEYSLDGTTFTSADFLNLAAGSYTLTVRDANGCTDMTMVTITEPDALALSVTGTTDVTCGNDADGTVNINLSGGTAPYTYSLDGTNFGDDSALSGLLKGDYTLTVRDANDCSINTMFTIGGPDAITATTKGGDVSCNGGTDGSVTVTAMGGNGGFTYSIDGTNFVTDPVFSGLAAGTYTLVVKDQNDCTITVTHTVNEPTVLTLQFESAEISCNGEADGQIAGFASGGTAPYQYSLDGTNFQTAAFQNLRAGTYTLTVKDDNDCTATSMVTISEPDVLMASAITTNVDCNGNSTGTAALSVTGGSTPYSYSLDGTTFNSTVDLSALAVGMYTVTVQDANNCEAIVSFTIEEPDALMLSVTESKDISCNGADDGSITVAATGGTGPYEYRLSDTGFITGNTFDNLAPGMYTIRVKDANDCFVEVSATIAEPAAITATAAVTDILCNGDATGSIALTAMGGTGTLEYAIDGTNFQTESSFTGLTADDYVITVRDANSCSITVSATVAQPDAISATLSISDVACNGEANGEISAPATGGTGVLQYALDGTNFQSASSFTGLSAGNYTVTVQDENGCTLTLDATVAEPDVLSISASLTSVNSITATAAGGTAPYEYSIDGTNYQSGATFSSLSNGNYTITVRDANGCTASLNQSIIVTSSDDDFIPSVVEAYPNPVTDYVMISSVKAGDVIMTADLKGSGINATTIKQSQEKYRHDVSGLNQGVFVLVIKDAEGKVKHRSKIMKVK